MTVSFRSRARAFGVRGGAETPQRAAGRFFAVAAERTIRVYKFRHSKRLQHLASLETDQSFDDLVTFFAVRASEETFSTTIVTLSTEAEARTYVYNHASRSLQEEERRSLGGGGGEGKGEAGELEPAPLRAACSVSVDPDVDFIESAAVLLVDDEGTVSRWRTELADPAAGWQLESRIRTEIKGAVKVACSTDGTSAIGEWAHFKDDSLDEGC